MSRRAGFQQRVYVLETVSDIDGITPGEIAAGTEITNDLPQPVNFGGTSNAIDTSDIGDRQDKQMLGTFSPGTIEFEVYRDSTSEVAYEALEDEKAYILVKFEGGSMAGAVPTDGDVYDAAPIVVGTKADVQSGRNEARRANVPCFVTGKTVRDAIVGGEESP